MRRRDFLKTGLAGTMALTGAGLLTRQALSQEASDASADDPDALAAAAVEHFIPGKRTCGESIVAAGAQALGIESELIPDIALGLAGGVGRQGETCGVITGAAVVLGLAAGQKESDYSKKKARALGAAGAFCRQFKQSFGATDCRALCGLDLTTPEGRKELKERVKVAKCRRFVEQGARTLAGQLRDV